MKSTGIVRRLDGIGRVVLPKDIRCALEVEENDQIKIGSDGKRVWLEKYQPGCVFCGNVNTKGQVTHRDKLICSMCLAQIRANVG